MSNAWLMRSWELLDAMDSLVGPVRVKPMNTRTQKTVWKERRRGANLPRSMKRRGCAK
jgi:hypothetical protein